MLTIRQTIGPDRYLLGCWGIPLEGIGIMNGLRTGLIEVDVTGINSLTIQIQVQPEANSRVRALLFDARLYR